MQIGENRVIDLTRVQVDGSTALTSALDSYPANYHHRRHYPAALLLEGYALPEPNGASERLPDGFMWATSRRLLGFDLTRAWRTRNLGAAGGALVEMATFLAAFGTGWLTRALEARSRRLVLRLLARPGPAGLRSTMRGALDDTSTLPMPRAASRARRRDAA